MSNIEIQKHPEAHAENGCGGEIELRIDHDAKKVTTVCLKCKIGSVVEKGKVIVDGQKIDE